MSLRIDPSSLIAGSLVIGDPGLGVIGSLIPSTGTNGAGLLYNDLTLPAENNDEFICRVLTSPAGGSLFVFEDSSFTATGYADGTYSGTYQGYKNGVSYGTAAFSFTIGAVASAAFSSAKTDGADTLAATAAPRVGASSATTDGADSITANVTVVSVAQLIGPTSDLSVGTWTPISGTTLFGMLNESVANDATYITTNQVGTSRVALGAGVNPGVTTGHIVRYRIVGSQTVSLMQGVTVIASWSQAPSALTTYAQTLTSPQAAAITNYSALSIQFQAT